ncbi:hypothetical protein DFH11DRAFT_1624702 [Phellopilus nigrolimitatus]|nr:hypothetical protein DFH11DRAFT_1624702 [Phellopilus nigrolimitatus]
MPSKILLIFCDGTGMDGNLTEGLTDENGGSNTQYPTNVLRLSRSVMDYTTDNRRQIVFYQSGVGSEANFKGDPVFGTTALQAFGTAVASKIRDAYAFIAQNFDEGDEICIFGFSRGAYTARKLSGLIDKIGLLEREKLGYFFEIWKQLVDGKQPSIPVGTRKTNIKCVGVWDTVGSVANEIDALSLKDTALPSTIDVALHGVSLQENRKKFLPTLWTVPNLGLGANQIFKQVWFPGAHSDVGGGYQRHELADIALFWMAGEVKSLINLDLGFLRRSGQPKPDPWGTSQPHNAYEELSFAQKPIIGHQTRLQSAQIASDSVFHESVKFSPTALKDPTYMVTLDTLKNAFGGSWVPKSPALNAFEKECKDNWGKPPITGDGPIKYEHLSDLFGQKINWAGANPGLLPPDAIKGGKESSDGSPLFVARAPYMGGLHPGKASSGYCWISYDGKEIYIKSDYEVLVGLESSVKWVSVEGRYSHNKLGDYIPVRGGREEDGTPLYIAQVNLADGIHCGKVKDNSTAMIPYNYKEHLIDSYRVLVFDEAPL